VTYKRTQEQTDHLGRVGSAATRPSSRGIFRDIPDWAQEPEEYFNSLAESYTIANRQLYALRSRAAWLKFRMGTHAASPGEIAEYQQDVEPLIEKLERELDLLRHAVTAAARTSWSTVFFFQAKQLLDAEMFKRINSSTHEILQRERSPSLPRLKPTNKDMRAARNGRWP
jgi:hypothetical protein